MSRLLKPTIPHYQTPEPLRKAMAERGMRSMELAMKIAKAAKERHDRLFADHSRTWGQP